MIPITVVNANLLLNARLAVDSPIIDIEKLRKEVERYSKQENGMRAVVYAPEGRPLGYVEMILVEQELPVGAPLLPALAGLSHITRIGVVESEWGKGIGGKLLAEAENWLKAKGARGVWLDYLPHNVRAANLYHRHGYTNLVTFEDGKKRTRAIAVKNLVTSS